MPPKKRNYKPWVSNLAKSIGLSTVSAYSIQQVKDQKEPQCLRCGFFLYNLTHNALPSLPLAKHFTAKLKQSAAGKFSRLSAKVGCISDNQLGGWYSYRASKAALNMLLKTLAIEWQRSLKRGGVGTASRHDRQQTLSAVTQQCRPRETVQPRPYCARFDWFDCSGNA